MTIGAYIFPLEVVKATQGGRLPAHSGPAGTAWWVEDTTSPYVFIFEPATRSLDLKSVVSPGDRIEILWQDCKNDEFTFTDRQEDIPEFNSLLQNPSAGIYIIVQPVGTQGGYLLHGLHREPNIPTPP